MLTLSAVEVNGFFVNLREREFARLDAHRIAYLDYAGSALYAASHLDAHRALLASEVFGNPHSEHGSSRASAAVIDAARRRVLNFLDAGDDYVVCFTANTTAAIKLVAEAYPFDRTASCVLAADNHNSVNGVREYARRAGSDTTVLPLRADLRLDHPEARLASAGGPGLFAFPAESNFSGVHHPLSLVSTAQGLGFHVLLDAAAFLPSHAFSLRTCPADFLALSFYKLFGYPTGVGALVARREALAALARPWFAGGTVAYASVQLGRHRLHQSEQGYEDGTANFLDIAALEPGFALRDHIGVSRIGAHGEALTAALLNGLGDLRHADGTPLVAIHGPGSLDRRGFTVAFTVLDRRGRPVPYALVEGRADAAGVQLRGGCFCNPGAAEAAFGFAPHRLARCLDGLDRRFSIGALQQCLGPDTAVGAVRASVGIATNASDITRALDVIATFAA